MAKSVAMQGNDALAESAIRAGMTFFAGYPITPQTEITEYLSTRMFEVGRQFVQAESELAAINMVSGAACTGHRAMTATAGPGFSLMAEGMSWMAGSRIPAVICDIGRGGAGNSNTLPAQADYNFATKSIGHGGFKPFVLAPCSVQETADFVYEAFDIADKYRCLVYIMSDGMLGHMIEPVELKPFRDLASLPEKPYAAHGKKDGEERKAVGWHLEPNGDEKVARAQVEMYKLWDETETRYEAFMLEDAEIVVAAWGTCARVAKTAIRALRAEGYKVGLIRAITLHPFPSAPIASLDEGRVRHVLVLENAIPAQFYYDVKAALGGKSIPLSVYNRCCGNTITPEEALAELRKLV